MLMTPPWWPAPARILVEAMVRLLDAEFTKWGLKVSMQKTVASFDRLERRRTPRHDDIPDSIPEADLIKAVKSWELTPERTEDIV